MLPGLIWLPLPAAPLCNLALDVLGLALVDEVIFCDGAIVEGGYRLFLMNLLPASFLPMAVCAITVALLGSVCSMRAERCRVLPLRRLDCVVGPLVRDTLDLLPKPDTAVFLTLFPFAASAVVAGFVDISFFAVVTEFS